MKRVAEEDEAADATYVAGDVGGHAAPHGFAANNDALRLVLIDHLANDRPIACLQLRLRVGHPAFRLHVFEIEFHREETTVEKLRVEITHEWRVHSLSRPVSQDDRGTRGPGRWFQRGYSRNPHSVRRSGSKP